LFRNLTWVILSYYLASVLLVVSGLYYFVVVLGFTQLHLIFGITIVLTVLMGMLMATLALEPLREHFKELERFTKETLHELNLPVSTIRANTEMLKKSLPDEKSRKRIERIESAAQMLQERYNELNYLIQKQMHQERIETFALEQLIRERIEFLKGLYSRFEFDVQLHELAIHSDRMGLSKVIDNLMENAVKYSGSSRHVRIILENEQLRITDFGVGMDEVALLKIFDRYYQNDATMPGFGIGLGVVKSYCDRHRIGLHVKSAPGEGTTVTLNFKEVKA